MNMKAELRNIRREILEEIDKLNTPMDFYNVQRKIILEIINGEKEYFNTNLEVYREHVLLLRNYGDTIPWLLLNQKGISKIYHRAIEFEFLNNNLNNTMHVLNQGGKYAAKGHFVILGAGTNFAYGNDIVICHDENHLVCIKLSDLNYGNEKIIGLEDFKISKNINDINKRIYCGNLLKQEYKNKKIDTVWEKINNSISEALSKGEGYCSIEDGNLIWAFKYNGDMPDMNSEMSAIIKNYNHPMIGSHFRVLEEPDLMLPPPSFWPIELENRMALIEGDIALMHYIDVDALRKIEKSNGYIKDILYKGNKLEENCIVVCRENYEKIYSSKFINDILYGYCKMDDIASYLINSTFA